MINCGNKTAGDIVYMPFNTFDSNGASVTVTNLIDADIHVHKDGALAQQTLAAPEVVTIDFDGVTGNHMVTIDTGASADADFYEDSSSYQVRLEGITVDTQTLNIFIGIFDIQNLYMRGTDSANTTTPPTAAAIVNEWESQSQADPTGFHVNVKEVNGTAQTANDNGADINEILTDSNEIQGKLPTNKFMGSSDGADDDGTLNTIAGDVVNIDGDAMRGTNSAALATGVNVTQISGDSTAADNLELQYDTTGLAGDTFPASQAQLAGIANVGAAVNKAAASYSLTTGTQSSGTYASTAALDGTNHEHTDDTAEMDLYYEFNVGSGVPTSVTVTGYLNGINDDLEVHGYDWVATAWVSIGILEGKVASSNEVNTYNLFVNMVGTGVDIGKVRIRFTDGAYTLSTATLAIDQIFVSFAQGLEGYENGAVWIDTTASNTNTVVGIDGTSRNPVSTIAAANTLSASTNLNRFIVAPGSSITFAASQDNQSFFGKNWTLALGGQSISGSYIEGADISGIATGASSPNFDHCMFDAVTLPPCHLDNCGFNDTITFGSAGEFTFDQCHSLVGGTSTPYLDFGSGLNASEVNMRHYSGGIEIQNMGAGTGSYDMSLEGDGQLIINANCSATSTISLRGSFKVTNNATGITLVYDDIRDDVEAIPTAVEIRTEIDSNSTRLDADISSRAPASEYDTEMARIDQSLSTTEGNIITEIDANETKIDAIPTTAMRGTDGANTTTPPTTAQIKTAMEAEGTSDLDAIADAVAHGTYGLSAIRTQGDAAWVTGGGGDASEAKQDTIIAGQTAMQTDVDANAVILDKVDDTLEDDVGIYRFTENALETAPSGTGSTPAAFVSALLAATGITEGGTMTVQELFKIWTSWTAGRWRLKTGETSIYEVLDADDDATVIMTVTLSESTPFRIVSIEI